MKKAYEYLDSTEAVEFMQSNSQVEQIIKQAQRDAVDAAIIEGARCSLINDTEWVIIADKLKQEIG